VVHACGQRGRDCESTSLGTWDAESVVARVGTKSNITILKWVRGERTVDFDVARRATVGEFFQTVVRQVESVHRLPNLEALVSPPGMPPRGLAGCQGFKDVVRLSIVVFDVRMVLSGQVQAGQVVVRRVFEDDVGLIRGVK
jgi:hypothetical protein